MLTPLKKNIGLIILFFGFCFRFVFVYADGGLSRIQLEGV